ncbi:hypothetical protein HY967_05160 [Candidatus Jorgensenbacteria bacterium]|nr:hypothetical protein [Candidatus Jorgensenbacteria bacterium]
MVIIPVVNCADFRCVKKRLTDALTFGSSWIHIDVADGKFTSTVTWGNPSELSRVKRGVGTAEYEVHLMVENPEAIVERWLGVQIRRVIVHIEAISNLNVLKAICDRYGAELMLALKLSSPVAEILPYVQEVPLVQILAVEPGPSGQELQSQTVDKIKFLKSYAPNVKIEVDGGITPETLPLVKEAGADIAVSGSYIFNSSNPLKAYQRLSEIASLKSK